MMISETSSEQNRARQSPKKKNKQYSETSRDQEQFKNLHFLVATFNSFIQFNSLSPVVIFTTQDNKRS